MGARNRPSVIKATYSVSHYNRLGARIWSVHSATGRKLLAEGAIISTVHIRSVVAQTPYTDFILFHSAEHLLLRNLSL